jgi:hypothetical protein
MPEPEPEIGTGSKMGSRRALILREQLVDFKTLIRNESQFARCQKRNRAAAISESAGLVGFSPDSGESVAGVAKIANKKFTL